MGRFVSPIVLLLTGTYAFLAPVYIRNRFSSTTSSIRDQLLWHPECQWHSTGCIYQTTINDDEYSDANENCNLVSPYHLLYPETFSRFKAPLNISDTLFDSLRLMKKSLSIFSSDYDHNYWSSMYSSQQLQVLRIEQKISHHTDPLCWLQAQIERSSLLSSSSTVASAGHPAFYIATADGGMETAVFGSSRTHRGSLDEDEEWWGIISPELPDRARVYGGQRFDSETEPSDEWKSFSRGFWMLPAVELRREKTIADETTSTAFTTTLAIHLVADSDKGFVSSAQHVLSIIDGLNDASVPAISPNLPPILSRSSTYQRQILSQSSSYTNSRMTKKESSLPSQDGQEMFENSVTAAVGEFSIINRNSTSDTINSGDNNNNDTNTGNININKNNNNNNNNSNNTVNDSNDGGSKLGLLEKVVLARRLDLQFDQSAQDNIRALNILRKWKFAGKPGGHLIYLCPDINGDYEFFGCTPERLFQVASSLPSSYVKCNSNKTTMVISEALAGTRQRGSTPQADQELSRQLLASAKDQKENQITGHFITQVFEEMIDRGWVDKSDRDYSQTDDVIYGNSNTKGRYFVRRLRHLQHICQQFQCRLSSSVVIKDVIRYLLTALHPTPAVGGYPKNPAMNFIRQYESIGFDRGYYSGPIGYVGREEAEIFVAIRSGLISRGSQSLNNFDLLAAKTNMESDNTRPIVYVFAGAGIVPGSEVQDEWSETSYKLAVVSSIFPQSPFTFQNALNPNIAWSTAFIEELVRNGITQFYICPGSRSTPLVAAISKVVRSNIGSVHALSVHDERGAGFRALGWGRGSGRPAVVITSSGTAVANLYPAIIEAGMDGVPLILITADRPYESRDTGANQSIDQVKIYSESYLRWFRDISPPHDDVPISVALADAAYGVSVSRRLMGPVHLNVQFRENLAPDAGPIRNDDRVGSMTTFDSLRFTDAAGFQKWSLGGNRWLQSSSTRGNLDCVSLMETIREITESKRGIIVVGNIRKPTGDNQDSNISRTVQLISNFALSVGYPIFAGVQSGSLRYESSAVVPFSEHLLRCPIIQKSIEPDLIIQLGAPLISTEIPNIIKQTLKKKPLSHILVHPHHPQERYNPDFTLSRIIDSDIDSFLIEIMSLIEKKGNALIGSQLVPLVHLGRMLQAEMPKIIESAAADGITADGSRNRDLTEPEIVMKISEIFTSGKLKDLPLFNLFLSNSMPVRDSEYFLYPRSLEQKSKLGITGVNRGASGIDGIIASASGLADSTNCPTLLLIGDVAALHDINSLHTLRTDQNANESQSKKNNPVTSIILNNNGGGIFSFLPIAKHGTEVAFEEFFATATSTVSFGKSAEAFDLSFSRVENLESFEDACIKSMLNDNSSVIEVVVTSHEKNVVVHSTISALVNKFISKIINADTFDANVPELLPLKHSRAGAVQKIRKKFGKKTLVLLHGWMGDKTEWNDVESSLIQSLSDEWSIFSVDLPGHGSSKLRGSSRVISIREALRLVDKNGFHSSKGLSLDDIALAVCRTLKFHGVERIDALAGYSLGGRVGLMMKRLSLIRSDGDNTDVANIINDETKMILVSAYPGEMMNSPFQSGDDGMHKNFERFLLDERRAREIENLSNRGLLRSAYTEETALIWSKFLSCWYETPMWGLLRVQNTAYCDMIKRRIDTLSTRGHDIAAVLRQCSPSRCSSEDWRGVNAEKVLYIAGELDRKYCASGRAWSAAEPSLNFIELPGKGHALLVEAAEHIAEAMTTFLSKSQNEALPLRQNNTKIWEANFVLDRRETTGISKEIQQIEAQIPAVISIGSLDFESYNINLFDEREESESVLGVGWGLQAKAKDDSGLKQRLGLVIQITSKDGLHTGIGEVSPLNGLHNESFEDAGYQVEEIADKLSQVHSETFPPFDPTKILSLDGYLESYIQLFTSLLEVETLLPSVRSGLEMSLISLSSSKLRTPIHQALFSSAPNPNGISLPNSSLPLNGLVSRRSRPLPTSYTGYNQKKVYPSLKVKIGHQNLSSDLKILNSSLFDIDQNIGMIRADANRGFNQSAFAHFTEAVKMLEDTHTNIRWEYIEEPLEKQATENSPWSLETQIYALEHSFNKSSIPYALDESLYDLLELHQNDFLAVAENLIEVFSQGSRGCAAVILKPSLLGLEMSIRIARFSRQELGIGAVFTSSFDSGIGLSYISFLASISDASSKKASVHQYPHGLSTFEVMARDTISPSFGSYVNRNGIINVASLSRAFFGLGLDEINSVSSGVLSRSLYSLERSSIAADGSSLGTSSVSSSANCSDSYMVDEFEASTSVSSSGREIVLVASLPLPFTADVACARFTDLPQQPRWSPWLASVAYVDNGDDNGEETEWTLRVRGVNFRWRAKSELVNNPCKGIRWESTSGVNNKGVVQFIPKPGEQTGNRSCSINVQMAFVVPRLLSSLFRGTIIEDFLRNKIMKVRFPSSSFQMILFSLLRTRVIHF